jgi:hypothetical protein
MSGKGQIFTLDVSIATLFLMSISVSILWISDYSFRDQIRGIENLELVNYGKTIYAEITDRIYFEEGVVAMENLEFDSDELLRKFGVNNTHAFTLELWDPTGNLIYRMGLMPHPDSPVFSLTAPVLIYNKTSFQHALMQYRFWRRGDLIVRGSLTITMKGYNNTESIPGVQVILYTDKGASWFPPTYTNASGSVSYENLPPGKYTVNASLSIFQWSNEVEIKEGRQTKLVVDTQLRRST